MRKSLRAIAMIALAGTIALVGTAPLVAAGNTNFSFDTGAVTSSGGDITFNGTSIAPVGTAMLSDLSTFGVSVFNEINSSSTIAGETLPGLPYSATPISGSSLVANEVFAVHTNSGNYGAALVTVITSTSITLQYITYNATPAKVVGGTATLGTQSGPAAPSITMVQNNYSYILPGAPNYGIAPGTLFIVVGTGMAIPGSAAILQNPKNALPQTLNGATVSVTVNGITVQPAFYYAIPTQLGLVLPSTTPVGTGTITVSYGGQTSAPAPMKVVDHAFGFDFYGGSLAAITDNSDGHLITTAVSAKPGEQIQLWGSGDGADTNNTDVSPPTHFDNLGGITALYFGDVPVTVEYQGRSSYQGVDQINVAVPENAPTGCAVSVVAVSGSGADAIVSNFVTMPIATSGGQCTDAVTYLSPSEASTLSGKSTVKFGGLSVAQETTYSGNTPTVMDEAGAFFWSISGQELTGYQSTSLPSLGSCFVTQSNSTIPTSPFTLTGLDAGNISVTGPNGTVQLTTNPGVPGIYVALPPPEGTFTIPSSGGDFSFSGTGGADVGSFTATIDFLNPLTWTNTSSAGTVTRASGVTVTWTGGAAGTFAQIAGNAASAGFSASFVCDAPANAGSFLVPPAVLLALPAGSGSLSVSNYTNPASVSIPNLDYAFSLAFASTLISTTYY